MVDLSLPWAIGVAVGCGCLIVPLFAALGRVPLMHLQDGRRLLVSVMLASVIWAGLVSACAAAGISIQSIDVVAGVAILISAAICAFLVISLLAWGFTISIARDLARAGRSLSHSEWKAAYADGVGFDVFARDRLALLEAIGVTVARDGALHLTGRGRFVARMARVAMVYFAVTRA